MCKSSYFWQSRYQNSGNFFQVITWNLCKCTRDGVLSYILRALEWWKFLYRNFVTKDFCWLCFVKLLFFQYFKNGRQHFDRHIHSPYFLENQSALSLSSFFPHDSVSCKSLFWPKPGKHVVILTSLTAHLSELASFPFGQNVSTWSSGG